MHTEERATTNIKSAQDWLIHILRAEVCENTTEAFDSDKPLDYDTAIALYKLSKKHDLAHIVSSYLNKHPIVADSETLAQFKREEITSVYRCEQIKYAYKQICGALNAAGIPYIPMKGSVLRPYYPKESMRTSCDIDMLVREEDLEAAITALENAGFERGEREYHDVSLFAPNKVHLELHFNIRESMDNLDAVLDDAWKYAIPVEESRFEFTKEFFVFHILAHTAYHFIRGGCGVRPLLDLWIMKYRMNASYEIAADLLEKAGIYKFAKEITSLVDVCFSEQEPNDFSAVMLNYIFDGGVYGTSVNKIAFKKSKNRSTFVYALKRFFLPYKTMIYLYPVLKKCPLLLPFCWIARLGRMIFGKKTQAAIQELKAVNNVTDSEARELEKMRKHLEL